MCKTHRERRRRIIIKVNGENCTIKSAVAMGYQSGRNVKAKLSLSVWFCQSSDLREIKAWIYLLIVWYEN